MCIRDSDWLAGWTDEYIALGLPGWNVNACAMGHMLITLYEVTGQEKYWDIVMEKVDYLRTRALRFGDSVLPVSYTHLDVYKRQPL